MVLDKGVSYLSWLAPQEEECALRKEFARVGNSAGGKCVTEPGS